MEVSQVRFVLVYLMEKHKLVLVFKNTEDRSTEDGFKTFIEIEVLGSNETVSIGIVLS